MKRSRIQSGLLAILCLWTCLLSAQIHTEYQVKAAFLYNFLSFVEWPPDAFPNNDSPLVITILGNDPFGKEIDTVFQDKRINGRQVVIERTKTLTANRPCHVLFVCKSERDGAGQIIDLIGNRSIFSIGDFENFASRGGVLDFFSEQGRLRFEINTAAVKRARLQVSSKLLRLARIVGKKGS